MALDQTREVASYLRNGSLWVGHFSAGNGELDFGDDRFDAAHGLANLVHVEATRATTESDTGLQPHRIADIHALDAAPALKIAA